MPSELKLNTMNKTVSQSTLVDHAIIVDNEKYTKPQDQSLAKEINGPRGLEPTRYGDWEGKGRCYDF